MHKSSVPLICNNICWTKPTKLLQHDLLMNSLICKYNNLNVCLWCSYRSPLDACLLWLTHNMGITTNMNFMSIIFDYIIISFTKSQCQSHYCEIWHYTIHSRLKMKSVKWRFGSLRLASEHQVNILLLDRQISGTSITMTHIITRNDLFSPHNMPNKMSNGATLCHLPFIRLKYICERYLYLLN